jgi:hypothetical protein
LCPGPILVQVQVRVRGPPKMAGPDLDWTVDSLDRSHRIRVITETETEAKLWKHVNKIIGSRSHGLEVTGHGPDIMGLEMVQESQNWINNKNRDMEAWNYGHRKVSISHSVMDHWL